MNPDHPVGRNKYRVIHSRTGLDTDDASLIAQQIRDGVRDGSPVLGKQTSTVNGGRSTSH